MAKSTQSCYNVGSTSTQTEISRYIRYKAADKQKYYYYKFIIATNDCLNHPDFNEHVGVYP